MVDRSGALELVIGDIERALEARIWYAALAVTLSLPDICSLLELPPDDNWSKKHKYAGWFDRNLSKYLPDFNGEDCYNLRGGVLHKGQVRRDSKRWDHIAFTTPDSPHRFHQTVFSNNGGVEENALLLDIGLFCGDMVDAVRVWFAANAANPIVQANLPAMMRWRQDDIGRQARGVECFR